MASHSGSIQNGSKSWFDWVDSSPRRVVLDGGLGHVLHDRGNNLNTGKMWSGNIILSQPQELVKVARDWLTAGVDIISTATYQVTVELMQSEFALNETQALEALQQSWNDLDSVRIQFWNSLDEEQKRQRRYPQIAVSMGPYSAVLEDGDEYSGRYDEAHKTQLKSFHETRARQFSSTMKGLRMTAPEILAFETMGNGDEARAIVNAMETSDLVNVPYWISLQCRNSTLLASGESVISAVTSIVRQAKSGNLVAIGVNCFDVASSADLVQSIKAGIERGSREHRNRRRLDIALYPNRGAEWIDGGWRWRNDEVLPQSSWVDIVLTSGAKIVGGCCGIGVDEIQQLSNANNCS